MYPSSINIIDPILGVSNRWYNENNILLNDGNFAKSKQNTTSGIEVGNFSHNVQVDDTVDGFEIFIKAKTSLATSPTITVYLVENQTSPTAKIYHIIGNINSLTSTETGYTFGNNSSLFGITANYLIANNIGLALVSNGEVEVGDVRMTVHRTSVTPVTTSTLTNCVGWVQTQPSKIIRTVNVNDTEIILANFKGIPDSLYPEGKDLDMSDFNATYFYYVLNEGTTREEVVKITDIQERTDGTVRLVVSDRGISLLRPTIISGALQKHSYLQKTHPAGSIGMISNPAVFYDDLMRCYGSNTTISGTAPTSPSVGAWWYNNVNNTMYYWNGTLWQTVNGGASAGVMALNGLTGNTTISAGTGISLNQVGQNIEINNTVSTGTLVPNTRQILTPMTVTGGGDLTADRTLTLVNDAFSPGNLYYYGTNAIGSKGWYSLAGSLALIPPARIEAFPSNTVRLSSDVLAVVVAFGGTYATYKAIKINEGGRVRISYDFVTTTGLMTAFHVTQNNLISGFSTPNTGISFNYGFPILSGTETFELDVKKGDIINFGCQFQGNISNFRIKFDYQTATTDGTVIL